MGRTLVECGMSHHIDLGISRVEKNPDGTLTVRWGYNNHGTNVINLNPEENRMEIKKGCIFMPRRLPGFLKCGYHMNEYEMVLIGDTEVVWNWFGQIFQFNTSQMELLAAG